MKKIFYLSICFFSAATLASCSSNLKSSGESLEPVIKAGKSSIGKLYTLTLNQVNVERDSTGAYVRLFDKTYKTIFIYVPDKLDNKIANLEKKNYIYKFKVTKNDNMSTLSGSLLEVADLNGKPISDTLKDKNPSVVTIILDGPKSIGKTYALPLVYSKNGEEGGKKILHFQSTDIYKKDVKCEYTDSQAKQVESLKANMQYKIKLKVNKVDWRVFGSYLSHE